MPHAFQSPCPPIPMPPRLPERKNPLESEFRLVPDSETCTIRAINLKTKDGIALAARPSEDPGAVIARVGSCEGGRDVKALFQLRCADPKSSWDRTETLL